MGEGHGRVPSWPQYSGTEGLGLVGGGGGTRPSPQLAAVLGYGGTEAGGGWGRDTAEPPAGRSTRVRRD